MVVGFANKNRDLVYDLTAQLGCNRRCDGTVWGLADERWIWSISQIRETIALSGGVPGCVNNMIDYGVRLWGVQSLLDVLENT